MTTWKVQSVRVDCSLTLNDGYVTWQMSSATQPGLDVLPSVLADLVVDGQAVRWADDGHATVAEQANGVRILTLRVGSRDKQLELTLHAQVFPAHPFVRLWAEVGNVGGAAVCVNDCAIVNLSVALAGRTTLFHVEQFSWNYRPDKFALHKVQIVPGCAPHEIRMGSFGSHYWAPTSCAWAALRAGLDPLNDPDVSLSDVGLVLGLEFNGKSRLLAQSCDDRTTLRNVIDSVSHTLAPGALFDIPACFVGRFDGDWDEAGYVTQRFCEAHVFRPMPDDRYPWVQYNSWQYGQDVSEAQQLAALDRCAELGVEVAVVDLGWARHIGDWHPDRAKFPRGLKPLTDRARELGIKFGVHMALAQMSLQAPAAQAHPEWLIHDNDDYFGAAPICLGHEPCREWLIGEMLRLIDEEGVDYIIQDGEDMVKHCPRAEHSHAHGDANYANSERGLDHVIATIGRERPHVTLENCEDGGCMMTYKMARLYHTSITVDNIATYATRQGVFGASYPFSPRYSVRYMQDDPTVYTLRSAIFGGPLILMQRITDWNAQQITATRSAIDQYKRLRTLVRDAKIIHLIAPRHNVNNLGWGWDAIQAVAPDGARSVVMVYRAMGGPAQLTLRPRGLQPGARYRVQLEDGGAAHSGLVSSDALEREGLVLALPEFGSEVIWLERQAG
jgi:alpha-galactosidase